jgi:hypothetical protein
MASKVTSVLGRTCLVMSAVVVLLVAACGSAATPSVAPGTSTVPAQAPPTRPTPTRSPGTPAPLLSGAPEPTVAPPFAFSADSVIEFYQGEQGVTCQAPVPSTKARGWSVRTCQWQDAAGRQVAIGVITDPAGQLGNGFASVTALESEDLLKPTDALDNLSGFLGAMIGEGPATGLLSWLAGHLGNEYAETSFGGGRIATYTESADDPTRIYLEVAGPTYLAAPTP